MDNKDLRRLSRRDLINIIYRLQIENSAQKKQIEAQAAELKERNVVNQEAGSIAEASLALSGIFEVAQKAADEYLLSIRQMETDAEKKETQAEVDCRKKIEEANRRVEMILEQTEEERCRILEETNKKMEERWTIFQRRIQDILDEHPEFKPFFNKS